MTLTIASIFSGIGAFEHAFMKINKDKTKNNEERLKYKIIFACDIDKYCKVNYLHNYSPQIWYDDVYELTKKECMKYRHKIDIFASGSPCQSFSIAGLRQGLEDDRGKLLFAFVKIIKYIQPKCFIFENVKGLLNFDNGNVFNWLITKLEKRYNIIYKIISPKNINFPQSRERIFIVGFLKSASNYDFNKLVLDRLENKVEITNLLVNYLELDVNKKYYITNNKWQCWICKQNLLDNRKMSINGDCMICQTSRQFASWHGQFILEYKKNANFNFCDEALNCIKNNKIIPFNIKKRRPTKSTKYEWIIKNSILRRLSPTECLLLMGFDSNLFETICSDNQTYKQCGNSIVVSILEKIILKILDAKK